MGTTSEKLTYLNTTKEKIRDSINLTGANLTSEDTFRSYASKLKRGYIDIINNGIDTLYNNFPKVSGIGSNLSLTPTYEAPMKLNEIDGNTLQDGTPTPDTPVEIQSVTGLQNVNVCGKNLFDKSTIKSGYLIQVNGNEVANASYGASDYIPVKANTQYTRVNCNNYYGAFYDSNKNFVGAIQNANTITPSVDGYVRISFLLTNIDSVQLEQGSTATEYEPYKGNTYEVNLGKNLWSFENKNVSWGTGASDVKNLLNSLSAGTYTLTMNFEVTNVVLETTNNLYGFAFMNSGGNIDKRLNTNSNISVGDIFTYSPTFTISSSQVGNFTNAFFYGFGNNTNGRTAESLMYDCQLEKGSQATSYSPYFTPIELNKIGDYQDRIYKNNGKWYVEKQIGKVVLNGSEGWFDWSNNRMVLATLTDYKKVDSSTTSLLMSNYYKAVSRANSQTNNSMCFYGNSDDSFEIIVCDGTNNTSTLLKAWLSTHNTEVLYVLATPTYTEITNTELIEELEALNTAKSQEGTTNISITSEDLEMILNVSALKGDVE